jgi:anti-anti-sigma regulatory factor
VSSSRQGQSTQAASAQAAHAPQGSEKCESGGGELPAVVMAAPDMTSCEQICQLLVGCLRAMRLHNPSNRQSIGREPGRPRSMLIDLRNVTQADTKLAACLVAVYQTARESSVRLELAASKAVLDTVEVCRLGWLIERTTPASRPGNGQ